MLELIRVISTTPLGNSADPPLLFVPIPRRNVQFFRQREKFLMEDDKMQKDIDKFRAETSAKYDDSQVLKEVRRKFENIESETSKNSGVIKEKLSEITDKVKQAEGAKKVVENVAKTAEDTAKLVGGAAESLGKTDAFKAATTSASALKKKSTASDWAERSTSNPINYDCARTRTPLKARRK